MKNFCVTSYYSIGCTFLDWTIHWVSGQNKFYNIETGAGPLCNNPVKKLNAHGHNKNFISDSKEILRALDQFDNWSPCKLNSFYLSKPSMVISDLKDIDNINTYNQKQVKEYNNLLSVVEESQTPIIYSNLNEYSMTTSFYINYPRVIEKPNLLTGKIPRSQKKQLEDILKLFFGKDADSVWDLREKLALDIRPFECNQVNITANHYYIDSRELWFDLHNQLPSIIDYLKLTIDKDRFNHWLPIYYQWQNTQLDILRFGWSIEKIIDAIVNNRPLDLKKYNLDLYKEIVILHSLLYKYNLNIKGYGLEKFPDNTEQIHTLLEKSQHSCKKYWR